MMAERVMIAKGEKEGGLAVGGEKPSPSDEEYCGGTTPRTYRCGHEFTTDPIREGATRGMQPVARCQMWNGVLAKKHRPESLGRNVVSRLPEWQSPS